MEQEQYEMAKRYAKGNREHMDTILVCQAEQYFKDQRFVLYIHVAWLIRVDYNCYRYTCTVCLCIYMYVYI